MPAREVHGDVGRQVTDHVVAVLASNLRYFAVHGSAATGDVIPGYSDLDVYGVVDEPVSEREVLALHERIRRVDPRPFAYVQPAFAPVAEPAPLLVPGAFVTLVGEQPPDASIQSAAQLRSNGEEWLEQLPRLVQSDRLDWAFATLDVERRARLALTRLKPAIRALLCRQGDEPSTVWGASWSDLVDRLAKFDDEVATAVARPVELARAGGIPAASEVGTSALQACGLICARHLGEP